MLDGRVTVARSARGNRKMWIPSSAQRSRTSSARKSQVKGNQRFALQVCFEEGQRSTANEIRNLKIGDAEGHFIPIAQLADVVEEEGPAQISRENVRRRISVEHNVERRDIAVFVAKAQRAIESRVKLPEGYYIDWRGRFEQLESASRRLAVAVPLALLVIFVLLYLNFGASTDQICAHPWGQACRSVSGRRDTPAITRASASPAAKL
jgi:Cu/Ag efflux pump CusA